MAWLGGDGPNPESMTAQGHGFPTAALDVRGRAVRVCAIICFDREHPEAAGACGAGGAELLLLPTACGVDWAAVDLLSVRALDNAMGIAMANYGAAPGVAPTPLPPGHAGTYGCEGTDCNGLSAAVDHAGRVLRAAPGDPADPRARAGAEGVYLADFNMTALRAHRRGAQGRALTARRLWPELCRLPLAAARRSPQCNDHRMWL